MPRSFGDLLWPSPAECPLPRPRTDVDCDHVSAVTTPACDPQHNGAKRVMLLIGALMSYRAHRDLDLFDNHSKIELAHCNGARVMLWS